MMSATMMSARPRFFVRASTDNNTKSNDDFIGRASRGATKRATEDAARVEKILSKIRKVRESPKRDAGVQSVVETLDKVARDEAERLKGLFVSGDGSDSNDVEFYTEVDDIVIFKD